MKKTLGLDLGIASIGWCLFCDDDDGNHERIIDLGSFVFNQIEDRETGKTENIDRRAKRSMRRQRRRKVRRLEFGRNLFKAELGVDLQKAIEAHYKKKQSGGRPLSPMELKLKGLSEKLTAEELCIALYHYLKYRGFKSNRKKEKIKEDGDKKMLKAMAEVREALGGRHITEYLLSHSGRGDESSKHGIKYHNADGEFRLTVAREWYRAEISDLLDKQIEFGVISEPFKAKYLDIYDRQRDFSDGPDKSSPYHHEIGKLIGKCVYDAQPRLPKDSYTARKFIFLSGLANLTYSGFDKNGEYIRNAHLKGEQIDEIFKKYFKQFGDNKVTYKQIISALGIEPVSIKGCQLSRKRRKEKFKKFCEDHEIGYGASLTPEQQSEFDEIIKEATLDQNFIGESKFLKGISKAIKTRAKKDAEFLSTPEAIDALADISVRAKTDARIDEECMELEGYTEGQKKLLADVLKNAEDEANGTIDLSKGVVEKLIPFLLRGVPYTNALYESGILKEGDKTSSVEHIGSGVMPPIEKALEGIHQVLRNPVVRHTLVQLRRLLNSIVKAYGRPDEVYVETGRELKKSFGERKELRLDQLDRRDDAISIRFEIHRKYPSIFSSIEKVNSDAVLRYRLYKEQHGFSPYTNEPIAEMEIFSKDKYEIDHIIPFSRSFDDSFNNKVLVETAQNRKKGNRLPYEYLGSLDIVGRFLSEHPLSNVKKKANLLRKTFNREEDGFLAKDAADNSYISVLARKLIEAYILSEGKECHPVSGAMTEKVRSLWRLGGHMHSYVPGSSVSTWYRVRQIDDYVYRKVECDKDSITFYLSVGDVADEKRWKTFQISKNKAKPPKVLPKAQEDGNEYIQSFIDQLDFINGKFKSGEKLVEIAKRSNILIGAIKDNGDRGTSPYWQSFVIGRLYQLVYKELDKKDRGNHLHHAIDAAVIASCTDVIINRITNFYKENELADQRLGARIPEPYECFWKELLLRVYERDIEVLRSELAKLPNYDSHEETLKSIHVLCPARLPSKDVVGAISKETVFGVEKGSGRVVKTVSVKKLKNDDIDKISDINGGSKALKQALREWFNKPESYRSGPDNWPILAPKGNPIKKVRVVESDDDSSYLRFSDRNPERLAQQSDVVRVRVYKQKDNPESPLYMVPVYYFHIYREKTNAARKAKGLKPFSDPKYTVMWAQGDNGSAKMSLVEIQQRFDLVIELNRYSLIELSMKDGRIVTCYSGGVTAGTFEIYSILGDNLDMVHDGIIKSSDTDRIRPSISSIKSIKLKNISPIGKIS